MAGKFEALIPKFSSAASHNITFDVFEESNPYLEIRVAVINLNIFEA